MDRNQLVLESFRDIQELIRFMDQKSGAILVLTGLIFAGFIEFAKQLQASSVRSAPFLGTIALIAGIGTITCLVILIWITIFKVLKPRFAKNYATEKPNLFYFQHLSILEKEEAREKFQDLSETQILDFIVEQKLEVSQILVEKIKYVNRSFYWLFGSMILLGLFILTSISL